MLDSARLGKQRVEVKQLLLGQYPNHPASKMWKHHEHALVAYGIICCKMWIRRGHADTLLPEFGEMRRKFLANDEVLVWPLAGLPPMQLPYLWPDPDEGGLFKISAAEAKRNSDWEIPTAWSYDHKTRVVIPQ